MPHSQIVGTGSTMPNRIMTNKDFEAFVETSDEWIIRRTGIRERRICSTEHNENTANMATSASLGALGMAGVSPGDLDLIVVGTVTPDQQFPSAACMVQKALQANRAAAFDVSAGCTGFLYALTVADNAIRCGTCKTALVVGAERLSSVINWKDRSTCVLLGDGAGAVVLQASEENRGILSTHLKSDGGLGDLLYSSYNRNGYVPESLPGLDTKPFHLIMEGNRLFKKAIERLASISKEALQHNNLSSDDISLLVPHQANIRIIEAVASNLRIPMEKIYTNLNRYGNTSSASIPIAMDEANRMGLLKTGTHILLISFGAGLTWGASLLTWCM